MLFGGNLYADEIAGDVSALKPAFNAAYTYPYYNSLLPEKEESHSCTSTALQPYLQAIADDFAQVSRPVWPGSRNALRNSVALFYTPLSTTCWGKC